MRKLIFILGAVLTFNCVTQGQQINNTLPCRNKTYVEHITKSMQSKHLENNILPTHNKKLNLLNSKSLVWRWDTIITFDTLNSTFQRLIQTFDAHGNVLIRLKENWKNNSWVDTLRYTFTYDVNGNMLTDLWELWQTNAWVNKSRFTFTYDATGNMLTDLSELWQTNAWVNNSRFTDTYDATGNMLTELYELWQTNAWVDYYRLTFTYDATGNMLTELGKQWQTNIWVNDSRDTYTYDATGNMLTDLWELWQTNAWVNYYRDTFTYDAIGNMLTYLEEQWQTNAWVKYFNETYTYDANGNCLTDLIEYWQTNAWVNGWRNTYTYDAFRNSITGKIEQWQGNWQPGMNNIYLYSNKNNIYNVYPAYRYQASYRAFTSGIPEIADNNSIIAYPNPATNNITIENSQQALIQISNIQGQLIKTIDAHDNKTTIDVSTLPSGVYILEVKTKKGVVVKKFLKE